MFDLKVLRSAMDQLEEEKGVSKDAVFEAIETSLAAAYKKEYGKRGQIIRADFNLDTGTTEFSQVKVVVDDTTVREEEDDEEEGDEEKHTEKKTESSEESDDEAAEDGDERVRYNAEQHIYIDQAQKIKKGVALDDEIVFQLEERDDFGRIAAQTAKQVIIQKIREAERSTVLKEFGEREGEVVSGTVERIDRGSVFVDLGKATGIMMYEDQIPRERFRQGERIRVLLYSVEETPRGVSLKLSRSHPNFVRELFKLEAPEIANGTVEIRSVAREPGNRAKIAVLTEDEHVDPVGACVGQRGVRVTTVMSELGGEKIDIIEWSDDAAQFIADALSPAKVDSVELDEEEHQAMVIVDREQLSLAIGRSGQNARLAAKLSDWKIDIQSRDGNVEETYNAEGEQEFAKNLDEVELGEDASEIAPGEEATPEDYTEESQETPETPLPETDEVPEEKNQDEPKPVDESGVIEDVATEENPKKQEEDASQQENNSEEIEEEIAEEEKQGKVAGREKEDVEEVEPEIDDEENVQDEDGSTEDKKS